jgi:hypothetical protein
MNRMIWAEGRELRAEGLGQRENRYGMNRIKGIYKISSISSVGMTVIIEGFQPGE